jgi:hypothetical protein
MSSFSPEDYANVGTEELLAHLKLPHWLRNTAPTTKGILNLNFIPISNLPILHVSYSNTIPISKLTMI